MQRRMIIQRIRNPQDKDQWVDVAITVGLVLERGSGPDFLRSAYFFQTLQLGDSQDQSEPFLVSSRADLLAAAAQFAADHPD